MYCRFCGALVGLGNPHECPKEPVRQLSLLPPEQLLHWTLAGCGIIAAILVTWAVSAAQVIDLRQVNDTLTQLHGALDEDRVTRMVSLLQQSDSLSLWVTLGALTYIVGYVFWFRAARKMVARFGDRGRRAVTHWTYQIWRISLLAAVLLTFSLNAGRDKPTTIAEVITDIEARTRNAMILGAVRCLTGLLLIVALVVAIRNVRALAQPHGQAVADPAT